MRVELSLSKREADAVLRGALTGTWIDHEGKTHFGGYRSKVLRGAEGKLRIAIQRAQQEALRDTGRQA